MPKHHEVKSTPETVHVSVFDAAIAPVIEVDSGDTVTLHCLSGGPDILPEDDAFEVLPDHLEVMRALDVTKPGHFMTGPVAVRGAGGLSRDENERSAREGGCL